MTLKEIFEELNQTGFSSLNKGIVNHSQNLDYTLKQNNQTAKCNSITTKQGVEDEDRISSIKKKINDINSIVADLLKTAKRLEHGEGKNFGKFKEAISRLKDKKFSQSMEKSGYSVLQLKQMSCIPQYKNWAEKTKEIYNNSSVNNKANAEMVKDLEGLLRVINYFEEILSSVKTEENYFPY